jgi:hypothetical protein
MASGFCSCLFLLITLNWLLAQCASKIKEIQIKEKLGKQCSVGFTIILFWVYFTALPYLQYHLNTIPEVDHH